MEKVKCMVKMIDRNDSYRNKLLNDEFNLVEEIKKLKWFYLERVYNQFFLFNYLCFIFILSIILMTSLLFYEYSLCVLDIENYFFF